MSREKFWYKQTSFSAITMSCLHSDSFVATSASLRLWVCRFTWENSILVMDFSKAKSTWRRPQTDRAISSAENKLNASDGTTELKQNEFWKFKSEYFKRTLSQWAQIHCVLMQTCATCSSRVRWAISKQGLNCSQQVTLHTDGRACVSLRVVRTAKTRRCIAEWQGQDAAMRQKRITQQQSARCRSGQREK